MASSMSRTTLSRLAASIMGPTSVPSTMPSPTGIAPMRSASRCANSSATERCTKIRLAAVQASPMLRILAWTAASTATSRSASAKTMKGALPPSSSDVRTTCFEACSSSSFPTAVEPVNESLRMVPPVRTGSTTSAAREVGTTFKTPAGRPTSSRTCASASVVSGVWGAGFSTIVQPAAMAGATLRAPMASGKFHGVMSRQGPTGCLSTNVRAVPSGRWE